MDNIILLAFQLTKNGILCLFGLHECEEIKHAKISINKKYHKTAVTMKCKHCDHTKTKFIDENK